MTHSDSLKCQIPFGQFLLKKSSNPKYITGSFLEVGINILSSHTASSTAPTFRISIKHPDLFHYSGTSPLSIKWRQFQNANQRSGLVHRNPTPPRGQRSTIYPTPLQQTRHQEWCRCRQSRRLYQDRNRRNYVLLDQIPVHIRVRQCRRSRRSRILSHSIQSRRIVLLATHVV